MPDMERSLLEAYRPWLRKVASGMTAPGMVEDLAQEGWIALWQAYRSLDTDKAPADWWLKKKAHGKMLTLVGRDWQTGKARAAGIPAGQPGHEDVADGQPVPSVWDELLPAADLIDGADWAYHHGDIAAALDRLTPREREYVVLRFWHGYQLPEMKRHFGYDPSGLWRRAKETLRGPLRHLVHATQGHTPEEG